MIDSLRLLFMHRNRDSKDQIAICRWHIAATSSKTGCYLDFCPTPARAKCKRVPFGVPNRDNPNLIRVRIIFIFWRTRTISCGVDERRSRRLDGAKLPVQVPFGIYGFMGISDVKPGDHSWITRFFCIYLRPDASSRSPTQQITAHVANMDP